MTPRIVITSGEPAGVGPDIVLAAAQQPSPASLVAIGNKATFEERARKLNLDINLTAYSSNVPPEPHRPGELPFIDLPLVTPCTAGQLCPDNGGHVLAQLTLAAELCQSGEGDALVTAPVHKGVINDFGVPFYGHTEFFAEHFSADDVVMMLVADDLRVALATTHLPLRDVPDALKTDKLVRQLRIIVEALKEQFAVASPRITVLGLNPHAGEAGNLGREEIDIIAPAISQLKSEGWDLQGPVPADSAFTQSVRAKTDVYLAMYHDQGLPVLKAEGFGQAINVSLGLPIIRTSVDHGTALDIAGSGTANSSSLESAIRLACDLSLGQQ